MCVLHYVLEEGAADEGDWVQCHRHFHTVHRVREVYVSCHIVKVELQSLIGPDNDRQRRAQMFPDVCQQHYWSCFSAS